MNKINSNPLLDQIDAIAKEKGVEPEVIIGAVQDAIEAAARKRYKNETLRARFNTETGQIELCAVKRIVENATDPATQVSLFEAQRLYGDEAEVDMEIEFPRPTEDLGRIAAQRVQQVIFQKVGEADGSDGGRLLNPMGGISLFSTAAVFVGFFSLPYDYYVVLRLVLCVTSLFLASRADLGLPDWLRWVLGGFAVLYNPIVPIRLGDKGTWEVLNVLTVASFWTAAAWANRPRGDQPEYLYAEFSNRVGDVVNGVVKRFDSGDVIMALGRTEALLPRKEQSHGENYAVGDRLRAVIRGVNRSGKGPQIVLSRSDPALLIKLFEQEVPEIYDGTVVIRGAVREAGDRAKVAVYSRESDVNPVGACIGMKGTRVQSIIRELRGEQIDIVEWSEDPVLFVTNAISPAKVQRVSIVNDAEKVIEVVVDNEQLSQAIGNKGQNVRLAAKLTGWKMDIKSEEEKRKEIEAQFRKS